MKRRITAMMLVFVMVFSLIPAGTMKAAGATTPTFTYDVSGSNATITGYTDTTVKDLVVPENVGGYTVTAIADGAFSWTKYPNLVNLTVRGANVNIGSNMCGFDSAGSRNDNIVLWGADGSTLETYATTQLLTFKEMSSQMSDVKTESDVANCYTGGGSFKVYTYIKTASGSAAEDIIWESEDSSQATVLAFGTPVKQNDGTYKAEATVNVLSKGDGTCKIYASVRGLDEKKELELTIKQSATAVKLDVALYSLQEGEGYRPINTLDSFCQNNIVTADKETYLWVKPSVVGSNEDYSEAWTSAGAGEYLEYSGEYNGGYMFLLLKSTGSDFTRLTFTSASLVCATTLVIKITNPATDFSMQVNGSDVDSGAAFLLIEGDKAELEATLDPRDSTDTVEWTSSNTNVATVATDGTLTTHNSGKATITCKISDTAGVSRTMQKSFELQVMKKVLYNKLGLSDSANGNVITELDLEAGKTCRVYPVDTEPGDSEANEHLIYTSSNSSLVTVDQDGNITATSDKTGSAIITASAARSDSTNTTASIVVNVYVKATSIGISSAEQIPQGQSKDVKYTLSPSGASEDIIWTPADASVVSVKDNGDSITITALKVGNTTIEGRSKSGGATVSIQVVVQEPIHMTNLGIAVSDRNSYRKSYEDEDGVLVYEVPKGENIVFEPDFLPLNSNDSLVWSYDVENANVATMLVTGTNCEVTAANVGKQTFTLKSSSGHIAKCRIEVVIPATRLDICNGTSTSTIDTAILGVGESITVNGYMGGAVTDYCKWTASNDNVSLSETQTDNRETLTITGVKTGTTIITATTETGEYSATLEITVNIPVKEITFTEGSKTLEGIVEILPNNQKEISIIALPVNNTAQQYTWTNTTGRTTVTPIGNGTSATIIGKIVGTDTIRVTADTGYTNSITVKVLQPSDSIDFTCTETTLNKGSKVTATAAVTPLDANDGIKYTASKSGVVKLTPASNGKSVTIEGIGVGTVTITATTGSGQTASINITVVTVDASEFTVTGISSAGYTYNRGVAIKPTVTVEYGSKVLKKDIDYTISYSNNTNATDEAVITITGIGKYSGTIKKTYKINPKSGSGLKVKFKANGSTSVSRTYTGTAYKPGVRIIDGTLELVQGKDFTVTYPKNPVKVGTYTVTVKYKGNYSGTGTASYKVTAKDISDNTILVSGINKAGYTYTTNAITPKITVKDGSKTLVLGSGKDYTVTYSSNTNASTSAQKARITIKGTGNYKGTRIVEFKINPVVLSKASFGKIEDKLYSGSEQTPMPAIKFAGKSVSASNFTLKYSANKNTGRATLTIKGKNNFKGTKKVYFKILPKQVMNVKQTNATKSSVTLSWTKAAGNVTGYNIYKYNSSTQKYTYVGTTTSTKYTVKKLSAGKDYKFAVCAYKKVGTSKYLGEKSRVYTAKTACNKPTISSISSTAKGRVSLTWKSETGANQYYVYVSTNGGKKYTLKAKTSSTSINVSGLTSGKKCYVKVKTVRNINGKSYTSAYSAVKSIKVK